MDWLDIVLMGAVGLIVSYVLLFSAVSAAGPIRRMLANLIEGAADPFSMKFDDFDREHRFRAIDDEVRRALGLSDPWGSKERADIVQAATAAQHIAILDKMLRKSVRLCLGTHWSVAAGLNTRDMGEAARHPLCGHQRQRVIDLADRLSKKVETYPLIFDAPELIRLQLGLRWIAPACTACPYWSCSVDAAPRVCPVAGALDKNPKTNTTRSRPTVIDAEIVDGCDDEPL